MIPLRFRWDDGAAVMLAMQADRASKQFEHGKIYILDVVEERSRSSHNHFFACVEEAWRNLPEELGDDFASAEHLRKWALIKAGFRDERRIALVNHGDARRVAEMARGLDSYAIVNVAGPVVTVYTAQSQSLRAMGKKRFAESKEAVLRVLTELIGVDVTDLSSAAARQT